MYLAQYEAETQLPGENRMVTLFMHAASNDASVFGYRPPTSYTDEYDRGLDEFAKSLKFLPSPNSEVYCFGPKNKFVNVSTFSLSPPRDISKAISRWIEWKMHDPETIQEIAQASNLESSPVDSDPRIREYDPDDRSQVEEWMEVGSELMMVQRILERINEQMASIGEDAPNHMQAPIKNLEANEKELTEKRKETIPDWWQEYENSQQDIGDQGSSDS
ncbi:hypothetical protein EST38_g8328 [Candolleomyces aberdarensis]|uniref:Uncharacterized protein n=1 Tax=Candolleomyces aberdarensis TaxID=2316362 RepID=A0A4Q2DF36_9AGAR|nr:hypothetical protein EST38_g8328 [Candolleomyces aberdarensis]